MRASELIKELQDQVNTHGDCDVWMEIDVEREGWSGPYTVTEMECTSYTRFNDESNLICIR